MRILRSALFSLLLSALVVSCSDQAPVAPLEDGPVFNFMNNPDNGNTRIARFEGLVFFLIFDSASPLVAVHSSFPNCGGGLEPVSTQWVLDNPDDPMLDRIREVTLSKSINIFIVDLSAAGTCFGFDLVASGQGNLVNTDNDIFVFLRDNKHSNAFGFTSQGRLSAPSGDYVHYNGVSKIVWDGETGDRFIVNEHFNLK